MTQQRSESDMLARMPITVMLGTTEYAIPVLTILPSRQWRVKLNRSMAGVVQSFTPVETISPSIFSSGLTSALLQFPELLAELVFDYAGDALPKDTIIAEATEEQLATAFSAIMQVAYPFLPQLAMTMKTLRASTPPTLPATEKFTN